MTTITITTCDGCGAEMDGSVAERSLYGGSMNIEMHWCGERCLPAALDKFAAAMKARVIKSRPTAVEKLFDPNIGIVGLMAERLKGDHK